MSPSLKNHILGMAYAVAIVALPTLLVVVFKMIRTMRQIRADRDSDRRGP